VDRVWLGHWVSQVGFDIFSRVLLPCGESMVYEVLFVETEVEQGLSSQDPRQQASRG
jgi:hypothetical protein